MPPLRPEELQAAEEQGLIPNSWRDTAGMLAPALIPGAGIVGPVVQGLALNNQFGAGGEKEQATNAAMSRQRIATSNLPQPDAAPQEPMPAAPAAAPAPVGGGDYGLGGLQRRIGAQQEQSAKALDGVQEKLGDSFKARSTALDDQAELAAQKAAETANIQRAQMAERDKLDGERVTKELDRQKHVDDTMGEVRKLQQEARDFKIDPDRRSVGQKGIGILAAMLGGMAQARNGGNNVGLDAIRQSINDDIMVQREELSGKRQAVGDKMNELGQLRQKFGDERMAEDAHRVRLIEQHKGQIDALLGEYAAPEALQRGEEAKALLDAEQAEAMARIAERANANAMQGLTAQAQVAGDRAKIGLQREELAAKTGKGVDNERVVPGVGVAVSKDAAKKAIEAKTGADQVTDGVAQLLAIRDKHGGGFSKTIHAEDAATIEAVADGVKMALKKQRELGVLSDKEYERMDAVVADAAAYGTPWSDRPRASLEALKNLVLMNTDRSMKNYGLPGYSAAETTADKRKKYGAR